MLGNYNSNVTEQNNIYFLIIIIVISTICTVLISRTNTLFANNHMDLIGNKIVLKITKKINDLDISYFDDAKMYDEIQNAKRDSGALAGTSWLYLSIMRNMISVITNGVILGIATVYLPFLIIAFNLPSIFVDRYMIKKRYEWERSKTKTERKIGYIRGILEGYRFAKDVRVFGTYESFLNEHQKLWKEWYKEKRKIDRKRYLASITLSIIPYIPIVFTFFLIASNIMNGSMSIGDYTFYTSLASQLQSGILLFFTSSNQGFESEMKLKKFDEFLSWPSKIKDEGTIHIEHVESIEFRNVYFGYPHSDFQVINNLSFKVTSNEKVALVGVNGAGKSTIVKLLLRLYEPDHGMILLNGVDIKKFVLKDVRGLFGVVFQDFNRYLLQLGKVVSITDPNSSYSEERVLKALDASNFTVDTRFNDGINTYLGKIFDENGVELSGGQWQKIAISQAYYKDSKYMIFDEPSSSLDPVAEKMIFNNMLDLCSKKGALFITHRLSCVSAADKILLIENGFCSECGTHSELLELNKTYANLFHLQAENYINLSGKSEQKT